MEKKDRKRKDRILIPGDRVDEIRSSGSGLDGDEEAGVVLGPGLSREGSKVYATKCGLLRCRQVRLHHIKEPGKGPEEQPVYWVDTHCKRYVANAPGDNVIGVVVGKGADVFRVDIGAAEPAFISFVAFEGATKKNRPNINLGDLLYAKVVSATKVTEPELVCVNSYGKKAGLGVLQDDGFVFAVPLNLVRKLLSRSCSLLTTLGKAIPFEIAVGMNGRIWVRAKSVRHTICLANAIAVSEHMLEQEISSMCRKLVELLSS